MDLEASKKKISRSAKFTNHALDQLIRDHYSSRFTRDGPQLVEVTSVHYTRLSSLIHKTFANCNISKICQVYVPQMYGIYKLRHEEMKLIIGKSSVKESILYHVTTESNALESLESGLDWRRTRRAKFGCGVSFSDDADYANFYADDSFYEETRVIMICSVLVKKTYVIPEEDEYDACNMIVPPGRSDTTVSHNGRVYVKYNDNDFYPLYFVYYQRRPEHMTKSKYFWGSHRARSMGLEERLRLMNL